MFCRMIFSASGTTMRVIQWRPEKQASQILRDPEKWHRQPFEQSYLFKGLREEFHAIFCGAAI